MLIENVAALAGRGLDRVLIDLARIGYDCEWDVIPAAAVGAPHLRERMFILAWPTGTCVHGPWLEPPRFDNWLVEPDGIPRLITHQQDDRAARLRCLGNAVVPQCAAWVGTILEQRLASEPDGEAYPGEWDAKYARGDRMGLSKCVGSALPFGPMCNGETVGPNIAGLKLPRAGRMTQGDCYERPRSFTAAQAKARALAHMAPTLRPRSQDHPSLPPLVPSPSASLPQDGEDPATWLERKAHHASKEENATRAGMPLAIYAQLKPGDSRLIPTPTAKDADSSRSRTAIRETPPARESQLGETLTDYVDPTNGGRLLPTPRASEWKGVGPLGSKSHDYRLEKGYLDATVQDFEQRTGRLNPDWVEWLQGFPIGWSEL